ncbi:MAG: hypothetical protein KGY81_09080, partial [Phycisphaerae bacterium]|nr:hypothetical protein [Phycisphaerae bacterium]
KDYGGLLARLDEPVGKPITFGDKDIRQYLNLILPASEIMIRGEEVVRYMQQIRIPRFEFGWRRHVYPDTFGPNSNTFIFGTDGTLLALPVVKRETVSSESRYRSGYPRLTATTYLREALADIDANIDPSNVPLTEQEEARLAWLGVELQPMDPELARANEVSDLTQNGRHGALVTYVYPASPAAEKGLKPGDILLRLFVEGEPKPLDVSIDDMAGYYSRGPFPWEQLDQVPEQYYDRIPRPWPPAENSLTRKLTDLGFGKRFEAQIYSGGERRKVPFEVVQSPKHHDTAEKFKSEDLGITVRNLTYEVRRFFRREDDEPGVIVSKIEPGSKASVAGIRPFEIITHVNDAPVGGVADFEKLVAPGGELRFSVKRWTKGRVVKMEGEMPEPEPDGEALGDGDTGQADGAETVDDDTAASTTDADAAPDTRDDTP